MLLSVVIPVRKEAGDIGVIFDRLRKALANLSWEILFVDDGSTDQTTAAIRELAAYDRRIRPLQCSRKFGHQAAVTAGLDFAEGDAVVVMDGGLHDPPELLPRMVSYLAQGYDMVSLRHSIRGDKSRTRCVTPRILHRVMSSLTSRPLTTDPGDLRLFSRRAVLALRSLPEQHRSVPAITNWLGLREIVIPFERSARDAGQTRFSLLRMLRYAWTAIISFFALSLRP